MTKRNSDPDGVYFHACGEACAEYAAGRADVDDIWKAWMDYYAETGEAFAANPHAWAQPAYVISAVAAIGEHLLREKSRCHVAPVSADPHALSWFVRAVSPKGLTGKRLKMPPWSGLRLRGIHNCHEDRCWLVVLGLSCEL